MKIVADFQLNKRKEESTCLTFFHFIHPPLPPSVVTFSFDRLVIVCLHIWGAEERERGMKNSDGLGEEKGVKARGRAGGGGMEKREKKKEGNLHS